MSEDGKGIVRFGAHEFDLSRHELRRSGLRVRLPPQPSQLLALLIRRAGEVVTREEIRLQLWPDGTLVDYEQGINHSIRQIRTVLGDDAQSARFVETLPRVGYRFFSGVVPVVADPGAANASEPALATPTSLPPRRRGRKVKPSIAAGFLGLSALVVVLLGMDPARRAEARAATAFQRMTLTELTADGTVRSAAISPDGRQVAYARGEEEGYTLAVRSLTSDTELRLVGPVDTPIRSVTFSPDGGFLYFVRHEGPSPGYSSLHRVAVLGGDARKLIFDVDDGVAFAPDGNSIAFVRGVPSRFESTLVIAGADGSGERVARTVRMPSMYLALSPAWSPDGTRIALARTDGVDAARVVVVDPASGEETPVGEERWDRIAAVAWLPGGDALLVAAEAPASEDRLQLWQLSYPGGVAARVSNDLSSYVGLSLIASGRSALALRRERTGNVWSVPREGGRARPWTGGTGSQDRVLALRRAAGDTIVYSTLDRDRHRLWRMDSPAGKRVPLLPDSADGAGLFSVSADGGTLVYAAAGADGRSHVFRLPTAGGLPEQITDGSGERTPAVCRGGEVVFFTRLSEPGIWRWSAGDRTAQKISDLAPYGTPVECSPDGSRIAFAASLPRGDRFERHLVVLPAVGGEPVARHPWTEGWSLRWAPDGETLTFARDHQGVDVWRMALEDGRLERLTQLGLGSLFTFDWSDDGSQLYVVWGSIRSDAVLISNLL